MYQNKINLQNKIKNLDSKQLCEVFLLHGLHEECKVIEDKNIDGEEFFNLSEMQTRLWTKYLTGTQTRRVWSLVELARHDPAMFFRPIEKALKYSEPSGNKYSSQNNSYGNKTNFRNQPSLATPPNNPSVNTQNNYTVTSSNNTLYKIKQHQNYDSNKNNFESKTNTGNPTNQTNVVNQPQPVRNNSSLHKIHSQQNAKKNYSNQPKLATPPNMPIFGTGEVKNIPMPPNSPMFGSGQNSPKLGSRNLPPNQVILPNNQNVPQQTQMANRNFKMSLPPDNIILPNSQNAQQTRQMVNSSLNVSLPPNSQNRPQRSQMVDRSLNVSLPPNSQNGPQKSPMVNRSLNVLPPNSQNVPQKSQVVNRNINVPLPPNTVILPNQNQINNKNLMENMHAAESQPSLTEELQNSLKPKISRRSISPSIQNRPLPSCPSPTPSEGSINPLPKPPSFVDFSIDTRTSTTSDEDIYVYDVDFTNYTFEKWYRKIPRDRARQLLTNKPNGSFVVRPSSQSQYICIVSLIYNQKLYNLPINKTKNNTLVIGNAKTVNTTEFGSVKQIIDYYTSNGLPLDFKGQQIKINLHHIN